MEDRRTVFREYIRFPFKVKVSTSSLGVGILFNLKMEFKESKMVNKKEELGMDCKTIWMGIDPGSSNAAMCQLNDDFCECYTVPTKTVVVNKKNKTTIDIEALVILLQQVIQLNTIVLIEDVHSMPNQGISSAFSFGRGLGILEGVISCFTIGSPHYISPAKWKKSYSSLVTKEMKSLKAEIKEAKGKEKARLKYQYKKQAKQSSIDLGNKLFRDRYPDTNCIGNFFDKGEHDMAEAFLMALYCKDNL
jgi:hypothetical protein